MYELDYENGEKRIEFMTRTPWLKNKITGKIEKAAEGYPIGDNARDPRWTGYSMSLHFNRAVINNLPLTVGPTEFYMSDGNYAQYVPSSPFDDPNAITYAKLLRERYEEYLQKLQIEDNAARVKMLKEVETTKREMNMELKKEYAKLNQLEIRSEREEAAKKRRSRAAVRGNKVAPNDGSVKETYDSKLAEITIIEKNLNNVKKLIKQLKLNTKL
tara:strand:- start:12942 stop:13586 length:645 start_codon:yes stop_codon:yes gene_type:complete